MRLLSQIRPHKKMLEILIKDRWNLANKVLVDIGCGLANLGFQFPEAQKVIVIDNDSNVIKKLESRKNVICVCENAENFNIKQKADYILSSHLIEHLDNPEMLLKRMQETLKDDGEYILACPIFNMSENKMIRKLFTWVWRTFFFRSKFHHLHKRVYSTKVLTKQIKSAGLSIKEIIYIGVIGDMFPKFDMLFPKFFARNIVIIGGVKND